MSVCSHVACSDVLGNIPSDIASTPSTAAAAAVDAGDVTAATTAHVIVARCISTGITIPFVTDDETVKRVRRRPVGLQRTHLA